MGLTQGNCSLPKSLCRFGGMIALPVRTKCMRLFALKSAFPARDVVDLEPGDYRLLRLMVLRRCGQVHEPHQGDKLEMIARAAAEPSDTEAEYGTFERLYRQEGDSLQLSSDPKRYKEDKSFGTLLLPDSYWRYAAAHPQVKPNQVNEWSIPLPDELIQAIREALKAEKTLKDKPAAKADAIKGDG